MITTEFAVDSKRQKSAGSVTTKKPGLRRASLGQSWRKFSPRIIHAVGSGRYCRPCKKFARDNDCGSANQRYLGR